MTWLRLIAGGCGLLTLVCATLWLRHPASPELAIANTLSGTRLYRLDLDDERIGFFETNTSRRANRVRFKSRLDATLPGGEPFSVRERFEFAAAPPHELLRASQRSVNGPRMQTVLVRRAGPHYQADITRSGIRDQQTLDWQYTLTDHLGLELWLRAGTAHAPDQHRVRSFDFDRLEPVFSSYKLLEDHPGGGFTLASAAPFDSRLVLLDADLIPQALSIAGLFTLTRAPSRAWHEPLRSRTHADHTRVDLSAPIPRPTDVRRLTLTINRAAAEGLTRLPGLNIIAGDSSWTLISDSKRPERALSTPIVGAGRESLSLPLPADDPRLLELLVQALGHARDSTEPLVALTHFVNGYLTYDETSHSLGLNDVLSSRTGDCTEFADLLTALARTAGYPAKTVTGLAYSDHNGPGLYLHAWTEVEVAGQWRGFDPTWDQTRVDATHLPFPDTDSGYLRAYAALPNMRFEVRNIEYF